MNACGEFYPGARTISEKSLAARKGPEGQRNQAAGGGAAGPAIFIAFAYAGRCSIRFT